MRPLTKEQAERYTQDRRAGATNLSLRAWIEQQAASTRGMSPRAQQARMAEIRRRQALQAGNQGGNRTGPNGDPFEPVAPNRDKPPAAAGTPNPVPPGPPRPTVPIEPGPTGNSGQRDPPEPVEINPVGGPKPAAGPSITPIRPPIQPPVSSTKPNDGSIDPVTPAGPMDKSAPASSARAAGAKSGVVAAGQGYDKKEPEPPASTGNAPPTSNAPPSNAPPVANSNAPVANAPQGEDAQTALMTRTQARIDEWNTRMEQMEQGVLDGTVPMSAFMREQQRYEAFAAMVDAEDYAGALAADNPFEGAGAGPAADARRSLSEVNAERTRMGLRPLSQELYDAMPERGAQTASQAYGTQGGTMLSAEYADELQSQPRMSQIIASARGDAAEIQRRLDSMGSTDVIDDVSSMTDEQINQSGGYAGAYRQWRQSRQGGAGGTPGEVGGTGATGAGAPGGAAGLAGQRGNAQDAQNPTGTGVPVAPTEASPDGPSAPAGASTTGGKSAPARTPVVPSTPVATTATPRPTPTPTPTPTQSTGGSVDRSWASGGELIAPSPMSTGGRSGRQSGGAAPMGAPRPPQPVPPGGAPRPTGVPQPPNMGGGMAGAAQGGAAVGAQGASNRPPAGGQTMPGGAMPKQDTRAQSNATYMALRQGMSPSQGR
jgi:hypothetical protein